MVCTINGTYMHVPYCRGLYVVHESSFDIIVLRQTVVSSGIQNGTTKTIKSNTCQGTIVLQY